MITATLQQSKPRYTVSLCGDRHALVKVSARLAYITKTFNRPSRKGNTAQIVSCYVGFGSSESAKAFVCELVGKRVEIRKAKRLNGCKFEVKISGLTIEEIQVISLRLTVSVMPAIIPAPTAPILSIINAPKGQFNQQDWEEVAGYLTDEEIEEARESLGI